MSIYLLCFFGLVFLIIFKPWSKNNLLKSGIVPYGITHFVITVSVLFFALSYDCNGADFLGCFPFDEGTVVMASLLFILISYLVFCYLIKVGKKGFGFLWRYFIFLLLISILSLTIASQISDKVDIPDISPRIYRI